MTTPNTPANADIAREAAILMHENSYFRNGLLTPNAFIDAATAEIRKAIERDRAERPFPENTIASVCIDGLKSQLAEREAELAACRKESDERYEQALNFGSKCADLEQELAELKRLYSGAVTLKELFEANKRADAVEAQLAEQSAALDSSRATLKECLNHFDGRAAWPHVTVLAEHCKQALAQIEALAGGTPLSGKGGAK